MQSFLDKLFNSVKPSGLATLLLSNIVFIFTLGLFYIKLFYQTYRCGKDARTKVTKLFDNDDSVADTVYQIALVLGKQLQSDQPDREYIERLERGKNLIESGQVSKLVLLGGHTGNSTISEAQAGKNYLLENGITAESVILEDKSRHTLENLQHARDMLSQETEQVSVLITSRYHLQRSSKFAQSIGLPHILCAAETEWTIRFTTVFKLLIEAYYLHWYFVGKYWSLLTNNKKWLQRIT